jgi:hypothetical protein
LRILCVSFSWLLINLTLSSCTPEKAKALRIGAVQFKAESFACIDVIDTMRQRELEPPPRTSEEVRKDFIDNILISDSQILDSDEIELARNPNIIHIDPEVENKWIAFISEMKTQYSSFAAIYDHVEQGSFLAAESVKNSAKYADKLTLQMAAFANTIDKAPPELLQYRTDIAAQLTQLKQDYQIESKNGVSEETLEPFRVQAGELLARWEEVELQEKELRDATVTQCLKAAILGQELRPLIDTYDQLDLDNINSIISGIFDTVASITGLDYSALKQKTTTVIVKLKEDEVLRPFAEKILAEVSNTVANRNPAGDDQSNSYLIDDSKIVADLKLIINGIKPVTNKNFESQTFPQFSATNSK